jgi:hypothetical protein
VAVDMVPVLIAVVVAGAFAVVTTVSVVVNVMAIAVSG